MKKILVITYYWPPSGGPGVQRVLKYCKYLPKYGWDPIILTVSGGDFPVLDESLKSEVKNLKIFRSKPLSLHKVFNSLIGKKNTPTFQLSSSDKDSLFIKFTRWIRLNLIIPDGRVGWYPGAVKEGNKIINQHKIDAIFSSAPPYTAHLIAKKLSLKNKIPWVADFRDPWTDRFYNYENKRWYLTEKMDKYLENSVIKNATKCITVSDQISKNYIKPFNVIFNGYDEEDFPYINTTKRKNVIISYLGTMTKSQSPECFFKAISILNENENNYKIDLVGNIHPDIKIFIEKKGYGDFIKVKPYIEHSRAIQKMVDSQFLLLVIPKTRKNKGIVTGKLFEYIRSMTKIIMIGPKDSDASKILKETSAGECFDYSNIKGILKYLSSNKKIITKNFEKYSRENLTKTLVRILNDATY